MRDLELMNVVSLIHVAKTWRIPLYLGGDCNGHIGNDHGGDDIHIGPFTSSTPTIPKGFVFAHTFANEDLYLEDSFHSLVRRGTWRHNNVNWYENDVLWTDTRAHKTVSKVKCSHVSNTDHVVEKYSLNIGTGQGRIGARSTRERIFMINTRKITETQKKTIGSWGLKRRQLQREDAVKKTKKDAANAFIATSAWQVEMMKIGKQFKPTHKYVTRFLELQKLKISRNYRQLNWQKDYQKISVLGVV